MYYFPPILGKCAGNITECEVAGFPRNHRLRGSLFLFMAKIIHVLIFAVLTLSFTPSGFAQTTLVVGVENVKYFPHYDNKNGEYIGYARAILDAFAEQHEYKFDYRVLPVKRLYREFFAEQIIDLKYPDNRYWGQDLKKNLPIRYSTSVVDYIDGTMVLPDRLGNSVEDLQTLGTIRGFTPWDYFDSMQSNMIKVSENRDIDTLLSQVLRGRIGGAYINIAVANYHLSQVLKKPGALVFDANLPHTKSGYHLSSLKHPEVIQQFSQFLQLNRNRVSALQKQYKVD